MKSTRGVERLFTALVGANQFKSSVGVFEVHDDTTEIDLDAALGEFIDLDAEEFIDLDAEEEVAVCLAVLLREGL